MGNSKIIYDGETLLDISNDSVTPETLVEGVTAHDSSGNPIIGTMKAGLDESAITEHNTNPTAHQDIRDSVFVVQKTTEHLSSGLLACANKLNEVTINTNDEKYPLGETFIKHNVDPTAHVDIRSDFVNLTEKVDTDFKTLNARLETLESMELPDVEKSITAHNENATAHQDIRDSITNVSNTVGNQASAIQTFNLRLQKLEQKPAIDTDAIIDSHNTDTTAHQDIRNKIDDKLSKSGDKMSGGLDVPSIGKNNYIAYPNDGTFKLTAESATGYIKITLPPETVPNTMIKFKVSIYNWLERGAVDYVIGGYLYTRWMNVSAHCLAPTSYANSNLPVAFIYENNRYKVAIGTPTTTWKYPNVAISDVLLGHQSDTFDLWSSGWSIELSNTELTNVNITLTDTNGTGDITKHNTSTTAHQDIRSEINTLKTGKVQRIKLNGQVQTADYTTSVIALCVAPTTAALSGTYQSYSTGRLIFNRANGLNSTKVAYISINAGYGAINRIHAQYVYNDGFVTFKPCVFKYNGIYYGGIEVKPHASLEMSTVIFEGETNFEIFGVDIYDSNSQTVLNQEIYDSLIYNTVLPTNGWYDNGVKLMTETDLTEKTNNLASAIQTLNLRYSALENNKADISDVNDAIQFAIYGVMEDSY